MFENIINFFKKFQKDNSKDSKDTAKERLHLVLIQDRANVSADFLELMKQEIIEVIKKYINVDENSIDVKLTNKVNADGTTGAPVLYANIPIVSLKDETKKLNIDRQLEEKKEEAKESKVKEKVKEEKKEESASEEVIEEQNNEIGDSKEEIKEEVEEKTENNESENVEEVDKENIEEENKVEEKQESKNE